MRKKACSSEDSSWNCQLSPTSRQIRQQIKRERDPPCFILMTQSPVWNRSSTLGMYIRGKWFAMGIDLGTQMSPTLGILRSSSANDGVTLRKVRREIILVLHSWGWDPSIQSIPRLHPNFCPCMESTVINFDCDVSYANCFRVESHNGHHTKSLKTQNYGAPGRSPWLV